MCPTRTKFGTVFAHGKAGGYVVYCGAVNAKNGFGGYTGDQLFIAMPDVGAQLDDGSRSFRKVWKAACGDTTDVKEVNFRPISERAASRVRPVGEADFPNVGPGDSGPSPAPALKAIFVAKPSPCIFEQSKSRGNMLS